MFFLMLLIILLNESLIRGVPLTFANLRDGESPYHNNNFHAPQYKQKSYYVTKMRSYIPDGAELFQSEHSLAEMTSVYKGIFAKHLAVGFLFLRNEEFRNKVIKKQTPRWIASIKTATHGSERGQMWQKYKYPTSIFFYIPNVNATERGLYSTSTAFWKGLYYGSFSATEVHERMQKEGAAENNGQHMMFRLLLEPDFDKSTQRDLFNEFGILALPEKGKSKNDNGVILWNPPEKAIKKYRYSTWNPNTIERIPTAGALNTYQKVANENWVNRYNLDLNTFKHGNLWLKIKEWSDADALYGERDIRGFKWSSNDLDQFFHFWQTVAENTTRKEGKFFKEWQVAFGEAVFLRSYSDGSFSKTFWKLFKNPTYNHEHDILISVWDSIGKRPYRFVKFRLTQCANSLRIYHGFRYASLLPNEWDKVKRKYGDNHNGHQWGIVSYSTNHRVAWRKFGGENGVVLSVDFSERNRISVTKYPNLHLIPLPGKVSKHPSEGEILLGDINIELIELDYNHLKDSTN